MTNVARRRRFGARGSRIRAPKEPRCFCPRPLPRRARVWYNKQCRIERRPACQTSWWTGEQAPPPLPPPPVSAEMLRISGRGNCKEAISSPGGKLPYEEIAANPAYTPPDSIEAREGCGPDELSRVFGQSARPSPRVRRLSCRAAIACVHEGALQGGCRAWGTLAAEATDVPWLCP